MKVIFDFRTFLVACNKEQLKKVIHFKRFRSMKSKWFSMTTYRINTESCCFSGGFRPDRQANKGPTHPWFATTWHGDQVGGQYNKNYFKEFTRKWSLIHRRQKCCCSWPATWLPWRHVQTSKNREARISLEAKPRTKLDVTWLANSYGLCSFEDTMEDSRSNFDR